MNKVTAVIVAGLLIITLCLIYIVKNGVSLRSAPVIGPTHMNVGLDEMARAIVVRLTPEFQGSDYLVLGINRDQFGNGLIERLKAEFSKDFKLTPTLLADTASHADLQNCAKPCWIVSSPVNANELAANPLLNEVIKPTKKSYFTLSILNFKREIAVPAECEYQKRITLMCLTPLAVRESRRKFKDQLPYFFMRKYGGSDYFLFLEN